MWKKEDSKGQGVPEISTATAPPAAMPAANLGGSAPASGRAAACISQGIRIKGEITGSEDLFVDGPIEGKLNLANGSLTVGPNGVVKADVTAREVVVRGRVEGKISGRDRVQLWSTGSVQGEIQTQRLAIEEGAVLRGKVETGKPVDKGQEERAAGSSSAKPAGAVTVNTSSPAN